MAPRRRRPGWAARCTMPTGRPPRSAGWASSPARSAPRSPSRTEHASLRSVGVFTNRPLLGAIGIALAFAAAVIYLPPLHALFGTEALSPSQVAMVAPFPFIVWGADEIRRWLRRRAHHELGDQDDAHAMSMAPTYTDRDRELDLRWWAAANYLTVAQIYLKSNPLLREPLTVDDIKPRLLGHWGTSPGLSMIYTLLNRLIRDTGTDCIYVTGPGHGGPALLANAYLEGTYSEIYPHVSLGPGRADRAGAAVLHPRRRAQPRQRADAGQHPRGRRTRLRARPRRRRRVRPPRPAGGLRGRRRRGRDRAAGRVVEDPRVPQRPPRRRGAADPAPQRLQDLRAHRARPGRRRRRRRPARRAGLGPGRGRRRRPGHGVHRPAPRAGRRARPDPARSSSRPAPAGATHAGPARWPAIILRTPKGWTGPDVVDGVQIEGTFRAHQVPLSAGAGEPGAPAAAGAVAALLPPRTTLFDARRPARPGAGRARPGRGQADVGHARTPTAAGCCARSTSRRWTATP